MTMAPFSSPMNPVHYADRGSDSSWAPSGLFGSPRHAALSFAERYWKCSQHDHKQYDVDGYPAGVFRTQQTTAVPPAFQFVPMRARKPTNPVRLGKRIVNAFTKMLFSDQRCPTWKVEGDSDAQDYVATMAKVGGLNAALYQARGLGGSSGSVGLSWGFRNGRPRFQSHRGSSLWVREWEDRALHIPRHVTECYREDREIWTGRRWENVGFWIRRDWTPDADIVFKPAQIIAQQDVPAWQVDDEQTVVHDDGVTHFQWVQNQPNPEGIDGFSDYDSLWDQLDMLDLIMSVLARGGLKNLDPTLVLRLDAELLAREGVAKGSDNALAVGSDGDAKYLELAGSSLTVGLSLFEALKREILDDAQCVITDPNQLAAQGLSSVAIKMVYEPMTAQCDVLRTQYGDPTTRMMTDMLRTARSYKGRIVQVPNGDGTFSPGQPAVVLPTRVVSEKVVDPMTGAISQVFKRFDRVPGESEDVEIVWPPYFAPTFNDMSSVAMSLQTATGGKAFLSKETASMIMATAIGVDPVAEWDRVNKQATSDAQAQAAKDASLVPSFEDQETPKPAEPAPTDVPEDEDDDAVDDEE